MRQRKPFLLICTLLAAFALLAAGCGGDDDTNASSDEGEAPESSDGPFRIAVVAPSASNDLAFTQSMIDALDALGETRDIEVDVTDGTFVVEDGGAALRGYAEDGFDLVIAHGSQYGAPLEEIAKDFPDVSFAGGPTTNTFGLPNVYAYNVLADQGGFALGAMAAALSESGVIGVIGPVQAGDAELYVNGFTAGATDFDPGIQVNVNWIESFSDVALAAEAAQAHLTSDADVLTGTAQMVVGATGVAREEGIPWFGTQSNQSSLGDENVVASQVYHWEVVLELIVDGIQAGTLGGEVYDLTFENGGLLIEFNPGFDLPEDVRTLGEDTVAGIADGSIKTGVS